MDDVPAVSVRDVTFAYPSLETGASDAARGVGDAARGVGVGVAVGGVGAGVGGDQPRLALERVSLDVRQGERLGILGPNGGGKSTLLKLILGLLDLDGSMYRKGEIRVMGLSPDAARAQRVIGYVPQRVEAELAFPLCARDVVKMAIARGVPFWKRLSRAQHEAIDRSLEVVGASAFARRPVSMLSGGQLQRIMLARALAASPRILLLDEPMVGVDPAGQRQFAELINQINRDLGVTVIVVSHDIRTVASGCDRIACLSRTLHSHTSPQGLTPRVLAEVFRHDVSAIFGELHVDAHAAATCTDPTHAHDGAPGPVALSISATSAAPPATVVIPSAPENPR